MTIEQLKEVLTALGLSTYEGILVEELDKHAYYNSEGDICISRVALRSGRYPWKKKGEWIVNEKRFGDKEHHCNLCGAVLESDEWKWRDNYYCYYCGADMREEQYAIDAERRE